MEIDNICNEDEKEKMILKSKNTYKDIGAINY